MKIVVVDGRTLNPGDLSWEPLEALGTCDIYDRSDPEELLQRSHGAQVIVTNKVALDKETIYRLPDLKYIGVTATGYNIIDLSATQEKNIVVTNVPVYGTNSVAQMVFALLLELTQHVGHHDHTVHNGKWTTCDNFCYWDFPMIELADLTMGIVGFGRIGRAVARLAQAFGMKVLAYDAYPIDNVDPGTQVVDLDTLLSKSDAVSLHCPLTSETQEFINVDRLKSMKSTAFLVNTSRGPLVHEADLANALNSGRIAGAGLDVLSTEPPQPDNPLLTAKNCIITPHIAWATRSARQRLLTTSIENVKAFIDGHPTHVVSN